MSGEKKKLCELPGPSQVGPRGAVLPSPGTLTQMEQAIPRHLVPPPSRPPPNVGHSRSSALKKKVILDEDDYVATLESIISRDFFPDVPRLKGQLRWLHSVSPADAELARRIIVYGKGIHATGSKAAALKEALEDFEEGAEMEFKDVTSHVLGDGEGNTMSLSDFLANHTSEDNESFQQLLEDMQAEHRRRYWWAYEETGGDARLLMLPSGERNTGTRKKRLLAALSPDSPHGKEEDNRPIGPKMWKHRTRNALMFQPDLRSSRDTCGVDPDNPPPLAIEDGGSNQRVGKAQARERGGIQHTATRIPSESGSAADSNMSVIGAASPLELPGSERSSVVGIDVLEGADNPHRLNKLVPMTPTIVPGAGGESPLMTWGEIQGTPLVLNTPSFEVRNQPHREQVAHHLQHSRRWRGSTTTSKRKSTTTATPTPRLRNKEGSTLQQLTPAAKRLAHKLAGNGRGASTPFGGGLSQRSVKQHSGMRKTKDGSGGTQSLFPSTPQQTPTTEKTVSTPLHKRNSLHSSADDTSRKRNSVTDNLLKL